MEKLLQAPSTNVSQLLGGRVPGISSVQTSGEPGLDQASLKIRGSVYGVTYIVDGIQRGPLFAVPRLISDCEKLIQKI